MRVVHLYLREEFLITVHGATNLKKYDKLSFKACRLSQGIPNLSLSKACFTFHIWLLNKPTPRAHAVVTMLKDNIVVVIVLTGLTTMTVLQ